MSRIKIKNFGPIKEGYHENDGWLDIKKVTVFIGNQGSGKSTVAKLISTLTWLEKALTRGDLKEKDVTSYKRFRERHCAYQKIDHYFKDNTEIDYEGIAYYFKYNNGNLSVSKNEIVGKYLMPKIMYVPAERNFVSAVDKPNLLKGLPRTLYTFLDEFEDAKQELKDELLLPIGNVKFEYQKLNDISWIVGDDYKIRLSESSSGFQSMVPLYMVTRYLALSINKESDASVNESSVEEEKRIKREIEKIISNPILSEQVKKASLEILSSRFKNSCFTNIVEEPEQNLFPSSQRRILNTLLEYNNLIEGNRLIITTHSPYNISYLSIAIQGEYLWNKIKNLNNSKSLKEKLNEIVPFSSLTSSSNVIVYQLDERNGCIKKLPTPEGIPTDKNSLNQLLSESNDLFDQLLEIEQSL